MRKLFILLAVLIATPVFALSIDMNDLGGGVVAIQYSDANALNLPRAFALEFTVDSPLATITLNSGSYKNDGVTEAGDPCGFGIYPARIVIDGNGNPVSYGSPLADPCDPGSGNGDGSDDVVLEFGSLYYKDANAPATSGTLCTLTIDCSAATTDVNLTMVDEAVYRGGVLLEDGTPVAVDQTILICEVIATECFPGSPGDPAYDEWAAVGKPGCWCVENDPDANPRQCHGDADGISEGKGNYWTSFNDLAVLKAGWNQNYAAIAGLTAGDPATPLICADFDHVAEGKGSYRVSFNDLAILKANWNQANLPDPNCVN